MLQMFRRKQESVRFSGNYKSWEDAERDSTGYASPEILRKTRAGLLKVKAGEAAFERDSVVFNSMEYEFPLLTGLLRAAAMGRGRLSVLDFGGSLGSTYFQSRKFLSAMKELHWSVVEQPSHVACGRADFANEELRFYQTIDECLDEEEPNVLLLSNVIQYLREPYVFLENISKREFPHVIIERTAFSLNGGDRLTVQHVPESIYKASYPVWFLSEPRFRQIWARDYEQLCEYMVDDKIRPRADNAVFKGFQFDLKSAHNRT